MRRTLAALLELLDWSRVYAGVLGGLIAAGIALAAVADTEFAILLAGAVALTGLVAGLLWQARAGRARR